MLKCLNDINDINDPVIPKPEDFHLIPDIVSPLMSDSPNDNDLVNLKIKNYSIL